MKVRMIEIIISKGLKYFRPGKLKKYFAHRISEIGTFRCSEALLGDTWKQSTTVPAKTVHMVRLRIPQGKVCFCVNIILTCVIQKV